MKHELLSPAGDMDSLKQAVANGADAVYCGCENFGARKFAKNFTNDEMIYAIKLCHLYGVKLYATMNTLVKDDEVLDFLKQVEFLYKNGIDAILIQDFGMLNLCHEKYPNLEIHASTQANVSSNDTAKFLAECGAKRVVFSREMTLNEIKNITAPVEKEVFIHGALCVSYSGCCLMSSSIGGRSANRGECAGCCRLQYTLEKNDHILKKPQYLLSMKELNTSNRFKELLDSNIDCFKIEGRMKSPEYVGYITRMYRTLIDNNCENVDIDGLNDGLKTIYNRGFTEGYLFSSNDILNTENPNHIGLEIGKVIGFTDDKIKIKLKRDLNQNDGIRFLKSGEGFIVNYLYDEQGNYISGATEGDIVYVDNKVKLDILDKVMKTTDYKLNQDLQKLPARQIPITFRVEAHLGQKISVEISDGEHNVKGEGTIIEASKTSPTTEERIREQIEKLGGTPFVSKATVIDADEGIFISISEINELRRSVVDELMNIRMTSKKDPIILNNNLELPGTDKETGITANVINEEQSNILNRREILRTYISNTKQFRDRNLDSKAFYKLTRCSRTPIDSAKERTITNDYFDFTRKDVVVGDYGLNVTNIYTAYYLYKKGIKVVTPSVELSEDEIINMINKYISTFKQYPRFEVLVYGRVENMVIKGNILDIVSNDINYYIKDPKGRKFPVYFDGINTHIYNHEKIDFKKKDLIKDYVTLRYDFYEETTKEIKKIFNFR